MNISTNISQCANEVQMYQRNSNLFKSNVYSNTVIAVLTLILSVKTILVMMHRSVFSVSTSFLIRVFLLVVNVHEIIYAFIQLWSLYRAMVHWNQPCSIMFTEYECFKYYTANIASRLMMLFMLCAFTLDRIVTLWIRSLESTKKRGFVLFVIAAIFATVFCINMTSDGPNGNIQPNCYQRLGRNVEELKNQISKYFYVILACLGLNVYTVIHSCLINNSKQRRFDLVAQVNKQIEQNSAVAIMIIVVGQLLCLGFYSLSVNGIIDHPEFFGPMNNGIMVLWCYTYPYACISLPIGILLSTTLINRRRRGRIGSLMDRNQSEQQNDHFNKLSGAWDNGYEMRGIPRVD